MDYKDYYAILGVPKTADAKAIKSAYRKKAKQFHPDLHPEHADKFKELGEAYEVLGDEEKRQRYDMLGSQWKQGQGNPSQAQYQQWGGGGNINYEDLFGGAGGAGYGGGASGFSDFFEAFFGGRSQGGQYGQAQARQNPQARQASPKEDLDLEQMIQVTLKEVIKGGTRSFYSNALKKDVTFKIPKGISSGKKIRVQGAGKASDYERGKKGDLLLKVTIDVPSDTTVEGLDITQHCKIPLVDMVLGGEHKVTIPSGDAISINIPSYSQTGQKLRIKGAGLPNLKSPEKEVGNLYLRLMPVLPKEHDAQASALYNAMKMLKAGASTK